MKKLIFVCTGNTCRSPMAEGLLRKWLGPNCGWEIVSAGICAAHGCRVSENALDVLREKEIDISELRSQLLTSELIRSADLVIPMTQAHQEAVLALDGFSEGKVFLLKSFGVAKCATDIEDPIGENREGYRRVRDEIDAALPDLILYMHRERI